MKQLFEILRKRLKGYAMTLSKRPSSLHNNYAGTFGLANVFNASQFFAMSYQIYMVKRYVGITYSI